jgi:integrase
MKEVQPIRDINQLRTMENILKETNYRDYIMFRLGIYSGYRISDIIKLKVKDLKGKEYFSTKEIKTGKTRKILINIELKHELDTFLSNKDDNDYIFGSKKYLEIVKVKTNNTRAKSEYTQIENDSHNSPISRVQAYRILNVAARKAGITEEIGTHTMRKTFGYWLYMNSKDKFGKYDVTLVQKILNHTSPQVTLRYIGIMQEDEDELIATLNF